MDLGFLVVAVLISFPLPFSSMTQETHWRTACVSLPRIVIVEVHNLWAYWIHPMKHASTLISPPECACRDGLLGFPTSARLKISISIFCRLVLYLIKILFFAWFPRETVCKCCRFLSICLARLGFWVYTLIISKSDRKAKGPKWGKAPWNLLKISLWKWMVS